MKAHERPRSRELGSLANGILIGAGGMYLLDPDRGRRRRAEVRNQGTHLIHRLDEGVETTGRDLRNRTRGIMAGARSAFRSAGADDSVLEARIRSKLGRLVSHPGAIEVVVIGGEAILGGPVLADEVGRLVAGVSRVRGIRSVRNDLTVFAEAGDVPGLQGTARRPEVRAELLQENWAPAPRFLAGAIGTALGLRGWRAGGALGTGMALLGGGLMLRAATNLRLSRITGVSAGRRAIDIRKTLVIRAPVESVFDFWSDFENLPRFMAHLKEVRTSAGGRSHWTAEGPGRVAISWDAEITAFEPQRVIGWKSIGTTPVGNAGIVRFDSIGPEETRIEVRMTYNPPAGAIGHVIASILGVDPKRALDDDLVRFKSLLEEGKTTAEGREIRTSDLIESRHVATGSD